MLERKIKMKSSLVSLRADNKIYIMADGGMISGFENKQKALDFFQKGYNQSHRRGYEASMSACINYITFQPAIHEISEDELQGLVEQGVIVPETFKSYSLNHISGMMTGALCTGENAEKWHESGTSPRLIEERF